MRSLFIYWKLSEAAAGLALADFRLLHAQLQLQHSGVLTGLYRRGDDTQASLTTCMATYHHPAGIGPALQQTLVQACEGLLQAHAAPRLHVEVFEELPP